MSIICAIVVYICVFMRASLSLSLSSPPHFYNLSFRPPSLNIFSPPLSLFFIVYLSRTPKIYFIFLSLFPRLAISEYFLLQSLLGQFQVDSFCLFYLFILYA